MTVSLCNNSLDTPRSGGENFNKVFNLISPELNSITPPLESNIIFPPKPSCPNDEKIILPVELRLHDKSFNDNKVPEQLIIKSLDESTINPVSV